MSISLQTTISEKFANITITIGEGDNKWIHTIGPLSRDSWWKVSALLRAAASDLENELIFFPTKEEQKKRIME